jgi:hypothetical protein
MNVILNPREVSAIVSLVTGKVLDDAGLSDEGKAALRAWREDLVPGRKPLGPFADAFNDALMDHIERSTARRYRKRGYFVRETERERVQA